MIYLSLAVSAAISFFVHDYAEKFLANRNKNIRLIFKGRHIHHSSIGLIVVAVALVVASGAYLAICFGYAIGNIWQHKLAHNRVNENGMVFVTKADVKN